jgi:predicted transposase YdaD
MPKPIDATLKDLLETGPADWTAWLGLTRGEPVRLEEAELSTVTAAADKVLWVEAAPPWILHLEFQAHWEAGLGHRLHLYNTLLDDRHGVPVHSTLVLLRRGANTPELTGTWERHHTDGSRYLEFCYDVVRVWQESVERLLSSGLATLPLAPLTDEAEPVLPDVVRRMQQRLAVAPPERKAKLWTATYLLMGLRYPTELADRVLQGVIAMEESVTYQAIIAKGEARGKAHGVRDTILRQGRIRFGEPGPEIQAAIQAITDLAQLERLSERLLLVSSWQELLATP